MNKNPQILILFKMCFFSGDIEMGDKTYYSIICWDDDRREMFGGFISELLDFDIRGH